MAEELNSDEINDLKNELCALIRELSYREGKFTLSSGKESDFYVDLKNVTLHPKGASLIAELSWQVIKKQTGKAPSHFGGVGGPTLGADPLATALSLDAFWNWDIEVPAYIIRKEPKKHGTSQWIEGRENISTEKPLLLLEDVVTTGGSGLKALEKIRAEGFKVPIALAVLDRGEGAKEAFLKEGVELVSLSHIDEIRKAR